MSGLAKSFALFLSFAGLLVSATDANAAACNSTGVGPLNWNAIATWSCGHVPLNSDDVTIVNNSTVTVNIAGAVANSVTIAGGANASTLTFAAGSSLAVTNNVVINAPTAAVNKQITVLTGSITVGGNVTLTGGGAAAQKALLSASTGSITINGGLTIISTVATSATVSLTGAGTITVNGAAGVTNGDTITVGTGTFNVTNAAASFTTSNASIASSATVAASGQLIIAGNTFVTGGSTASSAASITGTAGTIKITGNATVQGGSFNPSGATLSVTTGVLTVGGTLGITVGSVAGSPATVSVTTGRITVTGNTTVTGAGNSSVASLIATAAPVAPGTGINLNGTLGIVTTAAGGVGTGLVNLTGGGVINVNGNVNNGGTVTIATGTFNVTNVASTYANSSAVVIATTTISSGTLSVLGNLNNAASETMSISTTGNITVGGTLSNSGTITLTAGGIVNANGTFTNSGTFTNTAAGTLNLGGTATVNGTFNRGTGTVVCNGGAPQNLSGTALTAPAVGLNNFKINNANGVTLGNSVTVNGTLTFTSGGITTGANSVIIATTGTIATPSSTSYVVGTFQKNYAASANLNYFAGNNFPVGDATNFTPVSITAGSITAVAGNLSVSTLTPDHPQVATPIASTGIDAANSVNRYWRFNNSGFTVNAAISATFTFVAGDIDAGANTANFIVERYDGTNWNPTTLVAANPLNTQASNITPLVVGNNDFAIGDPLAGVTTVPGLYNAFETSTPAGSILGKIQTKIAGTGFAVDIVHINATKTGVSPVAIIVEVRLLDSSGGGALDVNGCNAAWPLIQAAPNFNIPASGRGTIPAVTVNNSYPSVRFQIRSPVGGPYTQIGCSTDLFAIRPASITLSTTDATWTTAGPGRTLNNTVATGGVVHAAGRPFTLTVSPQPATTTNYNSTTFTTTSGYPTCNLPAVCTLGTPTLGTFSAAGSGVQTSTTASYPEVGAINLQLEDDSYAAVDAVDGTPNTCSNSAPIGKNICSTATIVIGRFVPDHFDVTTLVTPVFKTFNATCTGARSFTYIGQPFGYLTTPQATVLARNFAGGTTANYAGALWKIGSGTLGNAKDCTTNPDICQLTTSWTNISPGNSSSVVESYSYTLNPVSTPHWDSTGATAAAASVASGAGTGTITYASSDTLAFLRNTTTPQATFTASITDTISVQDSSESGTPGNGTIATTTPAAYSSIAFDSGNQFYYGRLQLQNANGSQLISMPIPIQTQYWNGTAFVTNTADNCTTITANDIAIGNPQNGLTAAAVSPPTVGGAFNAGVGSLRLPKPSTGTGGSVDVAVNLTNTTTSASCTAGLTSTAGANMTYLQGAWCGSSYVNDPTARATFGTYTNTNQFIYQRENY